MSEQPAKYGYLDTSFQAAGGVEGLKNLVDDFYDQMASLEEAQKIFQMHTEELDVIKDKLSLFLCQWLGGPKLFREKYGKIAIPMAHRHLEIGPGERDAWMLCMKKAVAKQLNWSASFRQYFLEQIYVPAERSRNRGD